MSRVIKFRVWDKTSDEWITGPCEYVQLEKIFSPNKGKWYENDWVFQQFTGFFDIAGVEVYEGDIVEFHSGYPNQNDNSFYKSKSAVEFKNGAFWPRPILDHNDDDTWYNYELKDLKVIGNIFEHPELLK